MPRPQPWHPERYRKKNEEKRRKYIENLAIGRMSKKEAALAAGFSLSMARSPADRIETPEVLAEIERLERALLEAIPTEVLVQKYAEGLEATTFKTAQEKGQITDVLEVPDYPTRRQYLLDIARLSGRYQPKTPTEHTGRDGGPIELTAMTHEQLQQRKQWLEEQLGISGRGGPDGRALPPPQGGPEKGRSITGFNATEQLKSTPKSQTGGRLPHLEHK